MEVLKSESPSQPALKSFRKNTEACFAYYNKKCPYHNICNSCSNPLRILENENGEPPIGYVRKFWDPTKVDGFKPLPIVEEPVRDKDRTANSIEQCRISGYYSTSNPFSCSSCGAPHFGRARKCRECQLK